MTLKTGEILGIYVSTQTGTAPHASTGVYINGELYYQITDVSGVDCKYYEIPLNTNSSGAEFYARVQQPQMKDVFVICKLLMLKQDPHNVRNK